MFIKAIRFADVKPGDVVGRAVGEQCKICKVSTGMPANLLDLLVPARPPHLPDRGESVYLHIDGPPGMYLVGHSDQLIGLFHRPRPEGKTEQDMLDAIRAHAYGIDKSRYVSYVEQSHIQHQLQAIEAYELGKPLKVK